ncbi:hypothetical protein Bacsa_1887 [Phocaeicola salanitronis DSM 18170]|uniref:Uncharacterized protein n=1 Tax=Phocaeicola salanitronis (strain DSM 18170 / JCM 13657 / CCUG 60908 / BL78) TaxID=667015 RepID=F0R2B5_PHOSB|nr:hypothetical protein Bacsa_1887 [Phocaeicola salanitronis DSM 18170]
MQCKGCKCWRRTGTGGFGGINEKNIQNFFYFKEKPYLCKPKQTITRKPFEKGWKVTKTICK